jgi:hypothetical protein
MKSTFSFFKHFKIVTLLLFAVFVSNNSFAQTQEISVPFSEGFIGSIGNNSQDARAIKIFSTLGISKAFFVQQSTSGEFEIPSTYQGNDIPGTIRLVLTSGRIIEFNGAVVWRDSNTVKLFGILPDITISPINFTYGASLTYTISATSNLGFKKIGTNFTFADGENITGNAANGMLDDLNAYLTATQGLRPQGPVAVAPLNTTDTTPTITGTATLISGQTLSVLVNNVLYTTANGLSVTGSTWSLPISSNLTVNTYPVTATITNTAGYTLSDTTTNELVISEPPVITGPSGSGTSTGLTSAISIIENSTTVYTFTANKAVTWSLDGGEDAAKFSINSAGFLTFNSAPDFEIPTDGSTSGTNTYIVIIKATDSLENIISQTLTVTITDEGSEIVNTSPTNISLSPSDINENVANNSTVGTLSSTDSEVSEVFTYSLIPGAGDANNGSFSISGSNLTINNSPDFETKNSYTIRVRTTDHGPLFLHE